MKSTPLLVAGLILILVPTLSAQQRQGKGLRPGEVTAKAATQERYKDSLKVGDAAPDFTLPDHAGQQEVTLSSFRGQRPVVLVLGSFTCPPFRGRVQDVQKLYDEYKDRAQFLLVYIREAHPDSLVLTLQDGEQVLEKIGQTSTIAERSHRAGQCVAALKLSLPAVVDREDNAVNKAYAGWPIRLVVVDTEGQIAYYGGRGPAGFKPAEVKAWLEENVK